MNSLYFYDEIISKVYLFALLIIFLLYILTKRSRTDFWRFQWTWILNNERGSEKTSRKGVPAQGAAWASTQKCRLKSITSSQKPSLAPQIRLRLSVSHPLSPQFSFATLTGLVQVLTWYRKAPCGQGPCLSSSPAMSPAPDSVPST